MATKEEIEKLKKSWLTDPIWDIECTEGFEAHVEELLAFRQEVDAERKKKADEWTAKRVQKVAEDTGITESAIAQAVCTFEEIENQIDRSNDTGNRLGVEAAHARATLLLAAQIKRIADALEEQNEKDEADGNQDFMTKLYKVE